jgi:hypothetical protein
VIENPAPFGMVVPVGPDDWRWLPMKTKEDVLKLGTAMEEMTKAVRAMPERERQQLALEAQLMLTQRDATNATATAECDSR